MPMREECKHFQSRTYASGEVARFCVLDLAPEAPWRCPADCPKFARRLADAGWQHGRLIEPSVESEPDEPSGDIAALFDEAEGVIDAVAADAFRDVQKSQRRGTPVQRGWFKRRR